IARKIGRWVIGIVAIVATVTMGWATINVILNPLGAAAQKIAETTGTSGVDGDTAATIEVSLLPWLTVIGSVIGLIGALIAWAVGNRWPSGKTKKSAIGLSVPQRSNLTDASTRSTPGTNCRVVKIQRSIPRSSCPTRTVDNNGSMGHISSLVA